MSNDVQNMLRTDSLYDIVLYEINLLGYINRPGPTSLLFLSANITRTSHPIKRTRKTTYLRPNCHFILEPLKASTRRLPECPPSHHLGVQPMAMQTPPPWECTLPTTIASSRAIRSSRRIHLSISTTRSTFSAVRTASLLLTCL